jgi:formylglycine-generating enzyme required for sulfatase activity
LDQAGNVWEWVADCYSPAVYGKDFRKGRVKDPEHNEVNCSRRVLVGGSAVR